MVHSGQACCSFLVFELDERPDEIQVTITAPEAARAMADSLFAQFTTLRGRDRKFQLDATASPLGSS